MQIRTLIVDDEAPARSRLRQMLKEFPEVHLVGECSNGRQAIETIRREQPDLVFLDIQMPLVGGLEVCQALAHSRASMPLVVFVTAYDEYAVKAFELRAFDYLLKPFDPERLQQAVASARDRLRDPRQSRNQPEWAAMLQELQAAARKPARLMLKEHGRLLLVDVNSVDWVEADGNYVRIHAAGTAHYVRDTLTGLEAQLPPGQFVRINRSVLVNLERIKELQPLFYGDYAVLLQNGAKLNLSRTYRARLEQALQPRRSFSRGL